MKRSAALRVMSGENGSLWSGAARAGLGALTPGYRLAVALRNRAFDSGRRPAVDLGRPTISVGNLTTGGTGKTPMVIALCRRLTAMGQRPTVLLRGYKAEDGRSDEAEELRAALGRIGEDEEHGAGESVSPPPPEVSPAPPEVAPAPPEVAPAPPEVAVAPPEEAMPRRGKLPEGSPQPTQAAQGKLPGGLPGGGGVVVDPDRVTGAVRALVDFPDTTCFVLDDGFQHRRARRDLDLVLIDATNPWGYGHLLPRGLLREPRANLNRADACIITRADQVTPEQIAALDREIESLTGSLPIAHTTHAWLALRHGDRRRPLDDLASMKVLGVCGIGNPAGFARSLDQHAQAVRAMEILDDHHPYTADQIAGLLARARDLGADAVVTTEKDYVKWADHLPGDPTGIPVLRPVLGIGFLDDPDTLDTLLRAAFPPPEVSPARPEVFLAPPGRRPEAPGSPRKPPETPGNAPGNIPGGPHEL